VAVACPPIKALLHIMAYGEYQGIDEGSPKLAGMFTPEALLESEWYRERLRSKQAIDVRLWTRHVEALTAFLRSGMSLNQSDTDALLGVASEQLALVKGEAYLTGLIGSIGADPSVLARS